MNEREFETHTDKFVKEMFKVMENKNPDYRAGTPNVLHDYYAASEECGVTPEQAWFVLFMKHVRAVQRFVRHSKVSSESIHSRMIDIANYAILGDALFTAYGKTKEALAELEKREELVLSRVAERCSKETEVKTTPPPPDVVDYPHVCKICGVVKVYRDNHVGICPSCWAEREKKGVDDNAPEE